MLVVVVDRIVGRKRRETSVWQVMMISIGLECLLSRISIGLGRWVWRVTIGLSWWWGWWGSGGWWHHVVGRGQTIVQTGHGHGRGWGDHACIDGLVAQDRRWLVLRSDHVTREIVSWSWSGRRSVHWFDHIVVMLSVAHHVVVQRNTALWLVHVVNTELWLVETSHCRHLKHKHFEWGRVDEPDLSQGWEILRARHWWSMMIEYDKWLVLMCRYIIMLK